MPFFEGASGTNASHSRFNDVAGDQFNDDGKNVQFHRRKRSATNSMNPGQKHFAGDNHDYRAAVHRGDSYGQVNGGVVGGSGNINDFGENPVYALMPTSTTDPSWHKRAQFRKLTPHLGELQQTTKTTTTTNCFELRSSYSRYDVI
jgi:hypothetical protein